jgi:hypothetical protein
MTTCAHLMWQDNQLVCVGDFEVPVANTQVTINICNSNCRDYEPKETTNVSDTNDDQAIER